MSVTFAEYNSYRHIEKDNYNKLEKRRDRKVSEKNNRKLLHIEKYMRKNHLLFRNEFLEINNTVSSHIRIEYIEAICFSLGWLDKSSHLKIIHY